MSRPHPEDADLQRLRETGGPDRDQTDDLLIANEALYQLSYGPVKEKHLKAGGPSPTLFFGC
jgi:hypothetical protein